MLELRLYGASRYGKRRPNYYQFTDDRFKPEWSPEIYAFLLDQTVRSMSIVHSHIGDLDCFPYFFLDDNDVTADMLPGFVKELEKYFGKLKYTSKDGQRERGVQEFLEKNGIVVNRKI